MAVDYSLDPEDIACARLLAIGVRPRLEFAVFAVGLAALLAWSVSPWTFTMLPLLIGLTAGLGGFRLMQIAKVRQASQAAYDRNPTLRRRTGAAWDDRGITIQPSGASPELIPWCIAAPARKPAHRVAVANIRSVSCHSKTCIF
jgi:hypothetical protein